MRPARGANPAVPAIGLERWAAGLSLLAALALASPGEAQPVGVLSPLYEVVVRRYASGDREGAVAEMIGWLDSRIRMEIPALNEEWQKAGGHPFDPGVWRARASSPSTLLEAG
jgi:hypothetical protein